MQMHCISYTLHAAQCAATQTVARLGNRSVIVFVGSPSGVLV